MQDGKRINMQEATQDLKESKNQRSKEIKKFNEEFKSLKIKQKHLQFQLCQLEARQKFDLIIFGDYIANKMNNEAVEGIKAVYKYILKNYEWTISEVKGISDNDLLFLLSDEMRDESFLVYLNDIKKEMDWKNI